MKEHEESTRVSAIEQVYEERKRAQLDNDVEISILRSCGYRIPTDEEKLDLLAGRLLNFLDSLSEKDKYMIYSNAEAVAERRKKIRKLNLKDDALRDFEQETPLEMIFSSSRIGFDLFMNWANISLEDKINLLEAIKIGFETQHTSIDRIEDYIIDNYSF